jgi:predicted  nucleic acid-binding Zn-ribbon protein
MEASEALQRLRRQRNVFAVIATLLVAAGLAISLPRALRRHRELKDANGELLGLQNRIVTVQAQIRDVQAQITRTQTEMVSLQKEAQEAR